MGHKYHNLYSLFFRGVTEAVYETGGGKIKNAMAIWARQGTVEII